MLKGVIGLQMGKCLYGEKSNLKTPHCVKADESFRLKISVNYLFFAYATNELTTSLFLPKPQQLAKNKKAQESHH